MCPRLLSLAIVMRAVIDIAATSAHHRRRHLLMAERVEVASEEGGRMGVERAMREIIQQQSLRLAHMLPLILVVSAQEAAISSTRLWVVEPISK